MKSLPCAVLASAFAVCWLSSFGDAPKATRVFRPAQLTRGNLNVLRIQPIDEAKWIGAPGGAATANVLVFEKTFEVKPGEGAFTVDVSADERFYLTLDGAFVARGPNRADVSNWQYQTYEISLVPGAHVFRAVVTRLGDDAPLAQLSHRGGSFVLKASGAFDARLTTGVAKWRVGAFGGMWPSGEENGVWGTGSQVTVTGAGPFAVEPAAFADAVVVRGKAGERGPEHWGGRTGGWLLYPSQLPDQTEAVVRPGAFRAATHDAAWRANHVYSAAETEAAEVADFNRLLRGETEKLVIPARTRLQLAWHLGRYICAYPQLTLGGGKGARVSWTWTESSRDGVSKLKANRGEIVGKYVDGYGDVFVSDGRSEGVFSTPWFRCGLWCRIDVETQDEPLEIRGLSLVESRYPVEMESAFSSPDDPSLADIRRISTRAMQMCCHEMLFDCPYYEQQMYPGDSRVQLLVLSALSRDERMIKRVMELYDSGTRADGQCPFNYPSRGIQEGFTYTLCYLCMYGDYVMNHADREWLKARLPAIRHTLAGCEYYENERGLLEKTPGWNFMDWVPEWETNGTVPGTRFGYELNAELNLFWILAMQSAARVERAVGSEDFAAHWEKKAERLKATVVETFWSEERGLLADTPDKAHFSEHAQALAILGDVLPAERRDRCFENLVTAKGDALARTTVYFSYYLFEAYFKMGRADLFCNRLDLWRDYVKLGVTTLLERPDIPSGRREESRSDCHAWGAHPVWFMQTGLAGIRSDAPFFARVKIAPRPGPLKSFKVRHPHPQGWIEADLTFADGVCRDTVTTPVPGTFVFGGRTVDLKPGDNRL